VNKKLNHVPPAKQSRSWKLDFLSIDDSLPTSNGLCLQGLRCVFVDAMWCMLAFSSQPNGPKLSDALTSEDDTITKITERHFSSTTSSSHHRTKLLAFQASTSPAVTSSE
jgi:hypothetical protein